MSLTSAQPAMVIEAVDWASPDHSWRPAVVGWTDVAADCDPGCNNVADTPP